MIYIFIDESGDIGNPETLGNSKDFSLAACICDSNDTEELSEEITKFGIRLKKKEIKFSKMSRQETPIIKSLLAKTSIVQVSAYGLKTKWHHGKMFLQNIFKELVEKLPIDDNEKVKVFMDGSENAFFRKIYEPIIRKRFPNATLRFANSLKKPLIQVADFYAGQRRKLGK